MLAGRPGVKPDRMIQRFLSETLGRDVSTDDAASWVRSVALTFDINVSALDHAIWKYQSGRMDESEGLFD
jgi:hypothetical protein